MTFYVSDRVRRRRTVFRADIIHCMQLLLRSLRRASLDLQPLVRRTRTKHAVACVSANRVRGRQVARHHILNEGTRQRAQLAVHVTHFMVALLMLMSDEYNDETEKGRIRVFGTSISSMRAHQIDANNFSISSRSVIRVTSEGVDIAPVQFTMFDRPARLHHFDKFHFQAMVGRHKTTQANCSARIHAQRNVIANSLLAFLYNAANNTTIGSIDNSVLGVVRHRSPKDRDQAKRRRQGHRTLASFLNSHPRSRHRTGLSRGDSFITRPAIHMDGHTQRPVKDSGSIMVRRRHTITLHSNQFRPVSGHGVVFRRNIRLQNKGLQQQKPRRYRRVGILSYNNAGTIARIGKERPSPISQLIINIVQRQYQPLFSILLHIVRPKGVRHQFIRAYPS